MGMSASWIRVLRAAVFAALSVTLATGAHVLLSGAPLPLPTVALVAAGVFAVAVLLAGDRERGFWPIAGLLLPLHLAADTVFTSGQATCYGPGGGPVTGPLRLLGLDLICGGGDLGAPLARLTASGAGPLTASPWLLLAAHLAVGLLAAGWLRCGEAALARLLRAAVAAGFRPLLLAVAARVDRRPARRPLPRATGANRPAPALPALAHSVLRRGPPAARRYAPA